MTKEAAVRPQNIVNNKKIEEVAVTKNRKKRRRAKHLSKILILKIYQLNEMTLNFWLWYEHLIRFSKNLFKKILENESELSTMQQEKEPLYKLRTSVTCVTKGSL